MKLKKIIGSSVATIALAASLASGATYALFTSSSDVNIAITAGKVNVKAKIASFDTYSGVWDGVSSDYISTLQPAGSFLNGGVATIDGNKLNLVNITPMDRVVVNIEAKNESNVTVQYRARASKIEADGPVSLFDKLVISSTGVGNLGSAWTEWKTEDADTKNITLDIELPKEAGNEYQGLSTTIVISLEVVQGNADISNHISIVEPLTTIYEPGDDLSTMRLEGKVDVNGVIYPVVKRLPHAEYLTLGDDMDVNLDGLVINMPVVNTFESIENPSKLLAVLQAGDKGGGVYFIKEGTYEISPYVHAPNTNPVALIGLGTVKIITNSIQSDNAGVVLSDNTTLYNINFEHKVDKFAVKIAKLTTDFATIEKVLVKNCTVTGGQSIGFHSIQKLVVEDSSFKAGTTKGYSLNIATGTNLFLKNCKINDGKNGWKSVVLGVGGKEGTAEYDRKNSITFDDLTLIDGHIKIENDKGNTTFINLNLSLFDVIKDGVDTVYVNKSISA